MATKGSCPPKKFTFLADMSLSPVGDMSNKNVILIWTPPLILLDTQGGWINYFGESISVS